MVGKALLVVSKGGGQDFFDHLFVKVVGWDVGMSDLEKEVEAGGRGVKVGGVERGIVVGIIIEGRNGFIGFRVRDGIVGAVDVVVVIVAGMGGARVRGSGCGRGGGGSAIDMNINVGGWAGWHAEDFHAEDFLKVGTVFGREGSGVSKEEFLGVVVVSKPLKNGATETVDLVVGDGPGCVDTWNAAFCNGIEFVGIAFGCFVGAAFRGLGRWVSEVEEAWKGRGWAG
jgi:hypothetical protein